MADNGAKFGDREHRHGVCLGAGFVAGLGADCELCEECDGGDAGPVDFGAGPLAGGSCSTGRGVVCARAEDASLERIGGGAVEPGGATVTPGVELVAAGRSDDDGADAPGVVSRVADEDDALLDEGELKSVFGGESFGGDLSQFDLPLDATPGGS